MRFIIVNGEPMPNAAFDYYNKLAQEGKSRIVCIDEFKPSRSQEQNRFYWALLRYIEQQTGEYCGIWHIFCKTKFLETVSGIETETYIIGGKSYKIMLCNDYVGELSTTPLNSKQFTEYIDLIRDYFRTEAEIHLPAIEDNF